MGAKDYRNKNAIKALFKRVARGFFCSEQCVGNYVGDQNNYGNRSFFTKRQVPDTCCHCACTLEEDNCERGYGSDLFGEGKTYHEGLKKLFEQNTIKGYNGDYSGWTTGGYVHAATGMFMDYKKGANVNNNGSVLDKAKTVIRKDAAEGQKRLIARQATRLIRDSAIVLASRSDAEMAAKAAAFLNTDVGEVLVALVTSALASQLPDRFRSPEIDEIVNEIRVGTLTDKVDEAAEMFMAPLRQAGLQLLLAKNKANELTAGEAEPAKLEEPKSEPNTKVDERPPVKVTTRPARKTASKHPAVKVAVKVKQPD